VTLRANVPLAKTVEITGDFTNWAPVRLTSATDGSWAVTLPLKSGHYQMNIRVNGGPWRVPPGLLSMVDEFGGSVGLLIIE
jgi:1,4-alpha-glucan branching enzyme